MDNDFVQLLNRKGDIKVYKNIVISSNPLHLYEECSYYDEKVYNVFDLLSKLEEKDKEIERLNKELEEYKKDYDRIYTENCKLRQEHNITDISLLDENYRLNNIIDELEKWLEKNDKQLCLRKLKALKEGE